MSGGEVKTVSAKLASPPQSLESADTLSPSRGVASLRAWQQRPAAGRGAPPPSQAVSAAEAAALRRQCEDPEYLISSWDSPATLFAASPLSGGAPAGILGAEGGSLGSAAAQLRLRSTPLVAHELSEAMLAQLRPAHALPGSGGGPDDASSFAGGGGYDGGDFAFSPTTVDGGGGDGGTPGNFDAASGGGAISGDDSPRGDGVVRLAMPKSPLPASASRSSRRAMVLSSRQSSATGRSPQLLQRGDSWYGGGRGVLLADSLGGPPCASAGYDVLTVHVDRVLELGPCEDLVLRGLDDAALLRALLGALLAYVGADCDAPEQQQQQQHQRSARPGDAAAAGLLDEAAAAGLSHGALLPLTAPAAAGVSESTWATLRLAAAHVLGGSKRPLLAAHLPGGDKAAFAWALTITANCIAALRAASAAPRAAAAAAGDDTPRVAAASHLAPGAFTRSISDDALNSAVLHPSASLSALADEPAWHAAGGGASVAAAGEAEQEAPPATAGEGAGGGADQKKKKKKKGKGVHGRGANTRRLEWCAYSYDVLVSVRGAGAAAAPATDGSPRKGNSPAGAGRATLSPTVLGSRQRTASTEAPGDGEESAPLLPLLRSPDPASPQRARPGTGVRALLPEGPSPPPPLPVVGLQDAGIVPATLHVSVLEATVESAYAVIVPRLLVPIILHRCAPSCRLLCRASSHCPPPLCAGASGSSALRASPWLATSRPSTGCRGAQAASWRGQRRRGRAHPSLALQRPPPRSRETSSRPCTAALSVTSSERRRCVGGPARLLRVTIGARNRPLPSFLHRRRSARASSGSLHASCDSRSTAQSSLRCSPAR